MGTKDKKVDAYIVKSQDFARPVLNHLRELVHKGCPDVTEKMKWSFPNFEYHGILCNMAGFKQHCTFGFWKASLLKGGEKYFNPDGKTAMGQLGKITSLKSLPPDKVLLDFIKQAAKLNEKGIKVAPKKKPTAKKEFVIPGYFTAALNKNKKAKKIFEDFSYSHKKEYIEWITEAKTEATRNKRITQSIVWLAEGKSRNWKYMKR